MFGISAFAQAPFASLGSKVVTASLEDAVTGNSTLLARALFAAMCAESGSGSGAVATQNSVFSSFVTNSATGADVFANTAVLGGGQAESVTAYDPYSAQGIFIATATAGVSGSASNTSQSIVQASAAESATASVANAAQLIFLAALFESASAAAAQVNQANLRGTQAEASTGSGTPAAQAIFFTQVTENAGLAEEPYFTAQAIFAASRSEGATASSVVGKFVTYTCVASEGVSVSDAQAALAIFNAAILEESAAAGAFIAVRNAIVYPTGVQLVVEINDVLVWAVIPTPGDTGWVDVPTSSTTWTQITTSSATDWVNIPTTSTTWDEIQIPPPPDWVDVPT